jgi:predicted nucleotidyltransferase
MHTQQIDSILEYTKELLSKDLLGVYLFGSIVDGGLQKYSDLDILAVANRQTTVSEKKGLIEKLLKNSGKYMQDKSLQPIELLVVDIHDIQPWKYPPQFDFHYGEWLRSSFERGLITPWETKNSADLAILLTQIQNSSITLYGESLSKLIPPIPIQDFVKACVEEVDGLLENLDSDTRNVLLTLVRIWYSLENLKVVPKDVAAKWASSKLSKEYREVIVHAMNVYLGREEENWDIYRSSILPCANFLRDEIKK